MQSSAEVKKVNNAMCSWGRNGKQKERTYYAYELICGHNLANVEFWSPQKERQI